VHRNGANLSQIMEAFWPDAKVRRAAERLSTEVSNLRGHIRQAAGDKDIQPVVNSGSRYHLDGELVDVDVWRLVDALRPGVAATEPAARIAALREAIDAHTGVLAEGHDYDWIEPAREQLRRNGIRARVSLAELLAEPDPHTAAQLTRAAAALDPINEDLTRQAMRALARIGDIAAIRAQLHQLRAALEDIDEAPSDETITLAAHLERQISGGGRAERDGTNEPPPASEQ
jgi:DNA-binding SARP family transcriptional activator